MFLAMPVVSWPPADPARDRLDYVATWCQAAILFAHADQTLRLGSRPGGVPLDAGQSPAPPGRGHAE